MVIGEKEYPILGAPKVMPFGTLQEASRYYELTHNPVNLEQVVSTTFANIFFSEEGATTPALFGTLEEMLTRIGKHERWQYGKERAETRVEDCVLYTPDAADALWRVGIRMVSLTHKKQHYTHH